VCLSAGRVGWFGLGLAFALFGLLAPVITRWADRTRALIPGFSPPVRSEVPELDHHSPHEELLQA
jgi:hypothetical protein